MNKLKLLSKKIPMTNELWEIRAFIVPNRYSSDEKGQIYLSPECVSASEINYWADALIKDLEKIKRQANKLK